MRNFGYTAATTPAAAVGLAARPGATYIAGGTDLLNLMRDGAEQHSHLVDINHLDLAGVSADRNGLRIGALARMRQVADHPRVREHFPVLSQALLASASPQVRNMASIGGNLLQRTRCGYFRDAGSACNKRDPGSGCPAIEGQNRIHAIVGGSEQCIATNPSDLAVALVALEAVIHLVGPDGRREVPMADFHLTPGTTPHVENVLRPGELIVQVDVPASPLAEHSRYLKLRDRATFEFAVVSVASALRLRNRRVEDVRLAFGGIGTKPWRSLPAEDTLRGRLLSADTIADAGRALVRGAVPRRDNGFKVELVQRALAGLLSEQGGIR